MSAANCFWHFQSEKLLWSSWLNLRRTNTNYNQWGFQNKLLEKLFTEYEMEMWKWKIKLAHKSIPVNAMNFKVCFVSLHSLGVALSRGHGKYFFRGNVTIEEGKTLPWSVLLLVWEESPGAHPWVKGRTYPSAQPSVQSLGIWLDWWPTWCYLTFLDWFRMVGAPTGGGIPCDSIYLHSAWIHRVVESTHRNHPLTIFFSSIQIRTRRNTNLCITSSQRKKMKTKIRKA